ncbi:MAG: GNAT family N-acetyltransferase [Rubrobacteraceae bacterium]|jgi:ribosomal protein S18 acetylase RimI-like enzyme
MKDENLEIGSAREDDATQILALQKLCFLSQAMLYNDFEMPPLTQTLESLEGDIQAQTVLVARIVDEIIGSVRAQVIDGACHIERLIVNPGLQGRGLGTRLMQEIEARFPAAERYELFTGHRSENNLRLYEHLGYKRFAETIESQRLTLIHLEKNPLKTL